jgi:hypothetical protein
MPDALTWSASFTIKVLRCWRLMPVKAGWVKAIRAHFFVVTLEERFTRPVVMSWPPWIRYRQSRKRWSFAGSSRLACLVSAVMVSAVMREPTSSTSLLALRLRSDKRFLFSRQRTVLGCCCRWGIASIRV